MSSVDERIVKMQFQNQAFESGVAKTMSTLEKLKQKLNFKNEDKSLKELEKTGKSFNLDAMNRAAETVASRFSNLGIVGMTALQNIANTAVNAGKRIVSALTIDPIMSGFQEYETQINAVQTILANTSHQGTNLQQVNAALDELNKYADMTIYNFTEMTRNIGTFTAAGVDLDTSVAAIKGIANLAAVSGSTSQQASTAMYQLSQALAAGKVNLQDWNSVVNAGMGGKVFQDALMDTARVHGIAIDQMIKDRGSFRETLSRDGWLTADLLTETLQKFTGDLSAEQLRQIGYTEEQTQAILEMGKTANDAATKVKTFTQLWDTLAEAAQSGWTQTWEILVGDFEEAKESLTEISDAVSGFINGMSDARNNLLQGWKDLGGRSDVIDTIRSAVESLGKIFSKIAGAWEEVFPPMTSQQLYDITHAIKEFVESLAPSEATLDRIGRIAKGLFSVLGLLKDGFMALISPIGEFLGSGGMGGVADILLEAAASFGDFLTNFSESVKSMGLFQAISSTLSAGFGIFGNVLDTITDKMKSLPNLFEGIGGAFSRIGQTISNVFTKVKEVVSNAWNWIKENVTIGDIFTGVGAAGALSMAKDFAGLVKKIKDTIDGLFGGKGKEEAGGGIKESFIDILDSLGGALKSFTSGIKATTLLTIAGAVTMLTASLRTLSQLDPVGIAVGLAAIAGMMDLLDSSLAAISNTVKGAKGMSLMAAGFALMEIAKSIQMLTKALERMAALDIKGLAKGLVGIFALFKMMGSFLSANKNMGLTPSSGAALILMATAIRILASAVEKIGNLSLSTLAKGLIGVAGSLLAMTTALKVIDKAKISVRAMMSFVAIAAALRLIAKPLDEIGSMSWTAIQKGLVGIGGALAEILVAIKVLEKVKGGKAITGAASVLIISKSLDDIGRALEQIGNLSWEQLGKGLSGMGAALGELVAAMAIIGKIKAGRSLVGAMALVVAVQALKPIAEALDEIGTLSWGQIQKGLTGIGGSMGILGGVLTVMGKFAGGRAIFASTSILIAVQALKPIAEALKDIGTLSWGQLAKGLTGIGVALGELGAVLVIMGKLSPFGSLVASGSLLIAVQALKPIADALNEISGIKWESILSSVGGLGLVMASLATVTTVVGKVGPLASLLGSASLLVGVQALAPIADALSKLAGFSWDGISAAAFGLSSVLIVIGGMSTIVGAAGSVFSLLGAGTMLLGAQALGPIADALSKLGDMSWDEINRGCEGLSKALTTLAGGTFLNSLGLLGGINVFIAVQPLNQLADALAHFGTMSWDVIIRGCEAMDKALGILASGTFLNSFGIIGTLNVSTVTGPLFELRDALYQFGTLSWDVVQSGLEAMAGALGVLARGGTANTFAIIGDIGIATVAEPLGVLADSVRKWHGVSVPEDLEMQLTRLGTGLSKFDPGLFSSGALALAAEPLGAMADSVRRWAGVEVPEDIGTNLAAIAEGIDPFQSEFFVGGNLAAIVGPFGDFADSVNRWKDVVVPDGIEDKLKGLQAGISSFGLDFFTGGNLGNIVGPFGDFSEAVNRWNGVTIPDGIKESLQSLKDGIASFGGEFFTGGNLANIVGPFGDLADAVRRWEGVTFPTDFSLKDELYGLKNGLSSVSELDGESLASKVGPLTDMAGAISQWGGVTIAEGIQAKLEELSKGLKSLADVDVSAIGASFGQLPMQFALVTASLSVVVASINGFRSSFVQAGTNLALGLGSGYTTGITQAQVLAIVAMTTFVKGVCDHGINLSNTYKSMFRTAGQGLATAFANGISEKASLAKSEVSNLVTSAISGFSDRYWDAHDAGSNLAAGFSSGISSGESSVIDAAVSMATSAINAAKDALQEKSPSRVFKQIGRYASEGMAIGLTDYASKVATATAGVAQGSVSTMEHSLAAISQAGKAKFSPRITPVLDTSKALSDSNFINNISTKGMLNANVRLPETNGNTDLYLQQLIQSQTMMSQSLQDLKMEVEDIKAGVQSIDGRPTDTSISIDGKVIAHAIAKPMNRELGVLSRRSKL